MLTVLKFNYFRLLVVSRLIFFGQDNVFLVFVVFFNFFDFLDYLSVIYIYSYQLIDRRYLFRLFIFFFIVLVLLLLFVFIFVDRFCL